MKRNDVPLPPELDKWYCPYCGLQLTGNKHGDTHDYPGEAWGRYECEFRIGDEHHKLQEPISLFDLEVDRNKSDLNLVKLLRKSVKKRKLLWQKYTE